MTRSAAPAFAPERRRFGARAPRGSLAGARGPASSIRAVQTLLQTPLHDRHVDLGARLVPFAGWEMPVQYEGVIPEHLAVRRGCGGFGGAALGGAGGGGA